jgi:hypothetical protein
LILVITLNLIKIFLRFLTLVHDFHGQSLSIVV